MPKPIKLMVASSPFSFSLRKRSRTRTVSAVRAISAAGRRGVKLNSILGPERTLVLNFRWTNRERYFLVLKPLLDQFDGRPHTAQERIRINSHDKDQSQDGGECNHFARIEIAKRCMFRSLRRTENDPTKHPEHTNRRQNHSTGCSRSPIGDSAECSQKDEKLSDKPVESGKRNRRERHKQKAGRKQRQRSPQAAKVGNHPRVGSFVDHPDKQKQRAGRNTVIQHLVESAFESIGIEDEQTENDQSKMAY